MAKFKVGDKVRVTGFCMSNEPGTVTRVDIEGGCMVTNDASLPEHSSNDCGGFHWYFYEEEVELIPTPHFQIGQRYTQANGREVTCIALRDDGGMWAVVEMESTAAYAWDKDGNYLSCLPHAAAPYKIIFPPVIETVRIPFHTDHGDVYLSYKTKDGVPDWSSAEVVE